VTVPETVLAGLENKTYVVTAEVSDKAGNAAQPATKDLIVDTKAPEVAIKATDSYLNNGDRESVITIDFTEVPCKADGSALTAQEVSKLLSVSGLTDADFRISEGVLSTEDGKTVWTGAIKLNDGVEVERDVRIELNKAFYDKAGNQGNTDDVMIHMDTIAPRIESIQISPDSSTGVLSTQTKSAEVAITFSEVPYNQEGQMLDAESLGKLLSVSIPNVDTSSITITELSTTDHLHWIGKINLPSDFSKVEDTLTLTVGDGFFDQYKNTGTGSSATVKVDTLVTVGTLTLANFEDTGKDKGDKITSDDSFRLEVNGAEDGSRITYERSSDNQNWVSTDDNQAGLAEGTYYYRGKVVDKAGNEAYTASVAVTVDKHAEPGTLSLNNQDTGVAGDGVTSNDTFRLSVNDKEADSTVVYQRFEDGAWQNTEAGQSNLADGTYRYRAQITDKAGNVAETEEQSITIDKTAPTATVTIEDTVLSTAHPSIGFTIDFSEEPYGIENYQALTATELQALLQVKMASEANASAITVVVQENASNGGKTWTGTITLNEPSNHPLDETITLSLGDYCDKAGNKGTSTPATVEVDTIIPEISINAISSDNILNHAETHSGLEISGTTTAEVDQVVSLLINNTKYKAVVQAGTNENVW
ncbi:Ig-like domain-containing protein, partial [Gallibacterium anatis]|uniref:Ig-like domain-containing protein n=1 Tax=Gallibacterium anatis TaxID=750 RepID=UPI0018AFE2CF